MDLRHFPSSNTSSVSTRKFLKVGSCYLQTNAYLGALHLLLVSSVSAQMVVHVQTIAHPFRTDVGKRIRA
eukprot:1182079-Prorocentrum_minimum.AAC.3